MYQKVFGSDEARSCEQGSKDITSEEMHLLSIWKQQFLDALMVSNLVPCMLNVSYNITLAWQGTSFTLSSWFKWFFSFRAGVSCLWQRLVSSSADLVLIYYHFQRYCNELEGYLRLLQTGLVLLSIKFSFLHILSLSLRDCPLFC